MFPHEVVGFSGGNKYFFPGVSGPELIDVSHWVGALITSAEMIGTRGVTPVRALVNEAASLIPAERLALCLVVESGADTLHAAAFGTPGGRLGGLRGDLGRDPRHLPGPRRTARVLSIMPTKYEDIWTAAKGFYKLEPIVADGGEVIIYAPHITEISVMHPQISEIGYHNRDYFLGQWDRFSDQPWGDLAHSTHLRGQGTWDPEHGRAQPGHGHAWPPASREDVVESVNLGYLDPAEVDVAAYEADPDTFVEPHAGEVLYRIRPGQVGAGEADGRRCRSPAATDDRHRWVTARSRLNRPLALLVAGTFFMEILDGTILSTAAPAIAADLGVNPVDVNTAMTGYLIALAAGIPVSGWLTDRFGGRRILAVAIAVFTLASIACALSPTLPVLVAMRIVQGFGGSLMVPVGRLVVLRETSKADMLDAIAYLTWPALLAPVIAPTLGGWIVTVASWHWIFLINVPLGVLAFVVDRCGWCRATRDGARRRWTGWASCWSAARWPPDDLSSSCCNRRAVWTGPPCCSVAVAPSDWLPPPAGGCDAPRTRSCGSTRCGCTSFAVSNLGGGLYRMVISAVPFLVPLLLQVGFGFSPVCPGPCCCCCSPATWRSSRPPAR